MSDDGKVIFPDRGEVRANTISIAITGKQGIPIEIDALELYICTEGNI